MPQSPASLEVALLPRSAWFRVVGRATFLAASDFRAAVELLLGRGCGEVILDLARCECMDSTFIGCLVGLTRVRRQSGGTIPLFQLRSVLPQVYQSIAQLGVLSLFRFVDSPPEPAPQLEPVAHQAMTNAQLGELVAEAHAELMGANPENEQRFRDLKDFLQAHMPR